MGRTSSIRQTANRSFAFPGDGRNNKPQRKAVGTSMSIKGEETQTLICCDFQPANNRLLTETLCFSRCEACKDVGCGNFSTAIFCQANELLI